MSWSAAKDSIDLADKKGAFAFPHARQTTESWSTMFTIEHEFDATVITLIDEGNVALQEDITILAFDDCVVLEQEDVMTGEPVRVTFSMAQLADLAAALDLPEGSYRLDRPRAGKAD